MMEGRNGFSLLEIVLAIGIFAFAAALFIGLFSMQTYFAAENQDLAESMETMDDFCTFVEISSFADIKTLADGHATFYVTENSDDGVIFRKFVQRSDWELVDRSKRLPHTVEIKPMEALFTDEDVESRCYIPLLCRLSKANETDRNFTTFVTVKNY